MPRILLSLAVVLAGLGVIGFGGTGAFFSDTETSGGNTFAAGAIDLKVDNESYYNGVVSPNTSWLATDLTIEKFFNFLDLKPSDYGEDTISIHVDTNDSYLCANVTLKTNEENGQTEPEALVDQTTGAGQGELANLVNFIWWADDGDNVYETDENIISQGPLGALPLNTPYPLALADSDENIWGGTGPINGGDDYYIGKAWCFGTMTASGLTPDTYGSPADDNNDNTVAGEPIDGGFLCNGSALGNESQTDTLTADVSFFAVQSRNNSDFQCDEPQQACVPSTSNIFVNGGFEEPDVIHGDMWDVFPAAITGWTIAWRSDIPTTFGPFTRPEPGNLELHSGVLGAAHSGSQYAELDSDWNGHGAGPNGEPSSTVISQVVPTLLGATYSVDYWFVGRPGTGAGNNVVEARFNGVLLDTASAAGPGGNLVVGDWIHRGPFVFVATSTGSAIVSFTDAGAPSDSLGSFVDDITVLQTICPTPAP